MIRYERERTVRPRQVPRFPFLLRFVPGIQLYHAHTIITHTLCEKGEREREWEREWERISVHYNWLKHYFMTNFDLGHTNSVFAVLFNCGVGLEHTHLIRSIRIWIGRENLTTLHPNKTLFHHKFWCGPYLLSFWCTFQLWCWFGVYLPYWAN